MPTIYRQPTTVSLMALRARRLPLCELWWHGVFAHSATGAFVRSSTDAEQGDVRHSVPGYPDRAKWAFCAGHATSSTSTFALNVLNKNTYIHILLLTGANVSWYSDNKSCFVLSCLAVKVRCPHPFGHVIKLRHSLMFCLAINGDCRNQNANPRHEITSSSD